LAPTLPPCAACNGAEAPLIGAVAGTGGWLLLAPGTPEGTLPAAPPVSVDCWLRTVASAGFWFGLNCSDVASLCEKSMSAATEARRFSRPTTGSSSSWMRLV
jgi:hypothetical protein